MRGCRPLTDGEVAAVRARLRTGGPWAWRDAALFELGLQTGYRISELLSLHLGDVVGPDGEVATHLTVQRRNSKGRRSGRSVPLNDAARSALWEWVSRARENPGLILAEQPLFLTGSLRAMTRWQAYKILRRAYRLAGLSGPLATHTLRKTFANRVYSFCLGRLAGGHPVDPFRVTSKALGHANINSTDKYLSFLDSDVAAALSAMGV